MSRAKKLRNYQEELVLPGIRGYNYIICAPTGSGKTLTAASLCHRRMLYVEKQGKQFKATFIVPTRHLKGQQRDAFQDIFSLTSAVAITKTSQFRKTFDDPGVKILMITAQILVNALRDGQIRFDELSMLIFDECHHTTQNHSYNKIMKVYMQEKKRRIEVQRQAKGGWLVGLPFGGLPQIVGLTASLGTGGSCNAVRHIVDLCANLDCTGVVTVTDPANVRELEAIKRPPEQDEIILTPSRASSEISTRFVKTLEALMVQLEKHFSFGDSLRPRGSLDYQTWIGPLASEAQKNGNMSLFSAASYLLKLNMALLTYNELPARYVLHAFDTFKEQKRAEFDLTEMGRECREIYERSVKELKKLALEEDPLSTPMLEELVSKLEYVFQKIPNSRGIVLARTRFATLALQDFISHHHFKLTSRMIRATRIVGQGKEIEDAQSSREQEDALHEFRTGRANLLIATDIVQEGLDVPACNFIIRYNFVSNEIGTVQSKGRARAQHSQCFLLVEKDSMNARREEDNRQRVRDMDEAVKQINSMKKETWLTRIGEKQLAILAEKERETSKKGNGKSSAPETPTRQPNHPACAQCRKHTGFDVTTDTYKDDEALSHIQKAVRNMYSDRARETVERSLSKMSIDQRQIAESCPFCGRTMPANG